MSDPMQCHTLDPTTDGYWKEFKVDCQQVRLGNLRSALRFVHNLRRFDHVSVFRDVADDMLPMEEVSRAQISCLVHRVLTLEYQQYLLDLLQLRRKVVHRSTLAGWSTPLPKGQPQGWRKGFSYFGSESVMRTHFTAPRRHG